MQAIKDLISGKTADTPDSPDVTQSGREPASGQTGAGTTSEPYDAGNTTGDSSIGGAAPSESTYGSSNTNTGSAFGGSTLGSDSSNTGGVENTFGRDRGGPQPGNQGPHQISIANKLDPKVDSDGDGKSKSGPSDIEHATVPGRSSTAGQSRSTGRYSSYPSATGSTSDYNSDTRNTSGEIAGEPPSGGYSSSSKTGNTDDVFAHGSTSADDNNPPASSAYRSSASPSTR